MHCFRCLDRDEVAYNLSNLEQNGLYFQIVDHVHFIINFVIPCAIMTAATSVTGYIILRTAAIACQLRKKMVYHPGDGDGAAAEASTSFAPESKSKLDANGINDRSFRLSCISQIVSTLTFLLLCIPANVHHAVAGLPTDGVFSVSETSVGSYTTQRLLLVAWYVRHATVFTVHFVVHAHFRQRCTQLVVTTARAMTAGISQAAAAASWCLLCRCSPERKCCCTTTAADGGQTASDKPVAV